jgi:hypothetical protein
MMWSGVRVRWFRAHALMLDGMMGHRMPGFHHPGGDVYVHEPRERTLANRRARGEIRLDEGTRHWELYSSLRAQPK